MEYDKYLQHYKDADVGRVEAHFFFKVKTDSANPNFPEWYANEIEIRMQKWQEELCPGISYKRSGLVFKLDMVALKYDHDMDYFGRALMEVCSTEYCERINKPAGFLE